MPKGSTPRWLRPIHRWFFWWEAVVPSIYRVAAVAVAAIATAVLVLAVGLHPLVGAPVALIVWIGLAVAQEHDERIALPVDAEFHQHLRGVIDPMLSRHDLVFTVAYGPCRAREDRSEVFLYERADVSEGCSDFWIHRNRPLGTMSVDFAGRGLSLWLSAAGDVQLAERIEQASSPLGDVAALQSALEAVPGEFWS